MDIRINDISYQYEDELVLDKVSLQVNHGEIVALLGPSGCGKTTLLRLIAGLLTIQSGEIYFGDTDVSGLDPRKRNAVMVFQNYALFPHLSVQKNIEYGLKVRKIGKKDIEIKLDKVLETVKLQGLKDRRISELSGGQQQRVALARALVVNPDVLLFDEPLSNLDEKLRVSMRQEIRNILKERDTTGIYVTHDQEEAMSIADRIVILDKGIIQQIGRPNEIYEKPVNKFVAEFMGKCNFLEIDNLTFMLRPDGIIMSTDGKESGEVQWIEYLGTLTRIYLKSSGKEIIMDIPSISLKEKNIFIGDLINYSYEMDRAVRLKE
mgnify:CR=1 FL=1